MKRFLIAIVLFVALVVVAVSLKTPRMDRDFDEKSSILPDVTIISTSTVSVSNIRDWSYEKDEVVSKEYYTDTFDLNKMKGAYLLFNPFGEWDGVAHSFFVFEFTDGKSVSISIESRNEKGEKYNALKGFLNNYELWYAIGSKKDFLTQRAIYYEEDLYEYPLLIKKSSAQALFLDMVRTAEKLETEPAFYNTLTSNCTNLLADSANRVKKGAIPFHYSRLFTGYADNQLYDLKFIPHDKPFDEIYKKARIDEKIRAGVYTF